MCLTAPRIAASLRPIVLKIPPGATSADLELLKQQREEADRQYHAALAQVDASVLKIPDLPRPPPAPDEHQVTPLNQRWNILTLDPAAGLRGWRGWLARFVWRVVRPALEQQAAFNSTLVDHVNRNVAPQRAVLMSIESTVAVLRDQIVGLQAFESRLVMYLQRITAYVDTKDRHEDSARAAADVASAIEETAREVRQLSTSLASVQQLSLSNKRELERTGGSYAPGFGGDRAGAAVRGVEGYVPGPDAYKYVGFEQCYRGEPGAIRASQADYVRYFEGASDVLDLGCGRGEFLDLLREHGIRARGLDGNREMVEICRGRGLEVSEGDALAHLSATPDGSLGGLFAAQVAEHLAPDYLVRLLDVAYHKLRPGSRILLETINPSCWLAFFSSYLRDPTHVRPVHPDTLEYLLLASGFQRIEIAFRSPVPEEQRLQRVGVAAEDHASARWSGVLNMNTDKLNRLLFGFMDYAAIGERR